MDTAITALIVITVLLLAVTTLYEHYFSAQDVILESWREMEERMEERSRIDLSVIGAEVPPISSGDTVKITIRNEGDVKLAEFDQWDVILQYAGASGNHIDWHPYGSGQNQWTETIDEFFFITGGSSDQQGRRSDAGTLGVGCPLLCQPETLL